MSSRHTWPWPFALAATLFAAHATGVTLSQGPWTYRIDDASGRLLGADRDGAPFIAAGVDQYQLLTRDTETRADELQDAVSKAGTPDGNAVTLTCRNDPLGLTLTKTYRIEEQTGSLLKRVEVAADDGVTGQFWFESGVEVPGDWWRNAVIWQPVMHTGSPPFLPTAGIRQETNLAPRNGCRSVLMLYQPARKQTLVHWRWGGEAFEFFWVVGETPNFGKRAWPRKWLIGSQPRFVGGQAAQRVVIQMVYGVHSGSARDFLLAYADRDEYRALVLDPLQDAPQWALDTIIDEHWDTSYLKHGYDELLRDVLAKKLHFGYIQTILWGAFPYENYSGDPADQDEWDIDPTENRRHMELMRSLSPRIKAGLYSHYGGVSTRNGSRLHRLAEQKGWLTHRRDGSLVTHRTDYNMQDDKAAVSMTRAEPEYRELLIKRFHGLFEHLSVDFMNMDTTSAGGCEVDWGKLRAPSPREVQSLYCRFHEIALARGGIVTMNMPLPLGNTAGFSEWPWFPVYRNDWRHFSGRLAQQQALSAAGRRMYLAGFIMPAGTPKDESIRLHLNYTRVLALGLGMLDVKPVHFKRDTYVQGAPYIQAAYELRNRDLVDAELEPNWMEDLQTEIEVYAWRMLDNYGLVTVMNHDVDPVTATLAFDAKPLGLRPGRPVYVWRLEMADPREVDFSVDTMDSPIRRLARQELLQAGTKLPGRLSLELELPAENPVEVVLTASPAVVTSVDGKPCQYHLPAAYGVTTTGTVSPANGQVNVMVKNPGPAAGILIVLPPGTGEEPNVRQRKWSETHAAGVAVGYETLDYTISDRDGTRCLEAQVGFGDTEIVVN